MLRINVLLMVLLGISCVNAQEDKVAFENLKTISPEESVLWQVKEGVIIGGDGVNKIKKNIFLCTQKEYGDFELTCSFRLKGDHKTGLINSGIQYRSIIEGKKIIGYQADIGKGYWGDLYDEHRRGLLKKGNLEELNKVLKEQEWNTYRIRVVGNKHELFINEVKTVEYIDEKDVPKKGVIGFQLHSGGIATVEFKDIVIKDLSEAK